MLTEALIVIPVMTLLTVGILEFGNMMWQRMQLQAGVRDAARYWSRCRPNVANPATGTLQPYMSCSLQTARNIAFYGFPTAQANQRVPGWVEAFTSDPTALQILPATPPTAPSAADVVTVIGQTPYSGSPMMRAILSYNPTISYTVEMRYIGW